MKLFAINRHVWPSQGDRKVRVHRYIVQAETADEAMIKVARDNAYTPDAVLTVRNEFGPDDVIGWDLYFDPKDLFPKDAPLVRDLIAKREAA